MRNSLLVAAAMLIALPGVLLAQQAAPVAPESWEEVAAQVQLATVTVRILPAADEPAPRVAGPAAQPADPPAATQKVSVCSGVVLGGGLVATHVDANLDGRIRLTLPGGAQAEARVRVFDQFSGLALLEFGNRELAGIPLAAEDALPRVGASVLSSAAWGAEKPVIAIGHVGGVDRTLAGASLPPLLQCGLRAVETSAGGPVVDRSGRLVGIVVAADPAGDARGWTYALPVSHLHALKRVMVPGKVVVIPRRRPIVGLVLTQGDDPETVVVQKIDKGGPAEKTGVAVGDKVLAVDGLMVRSVYQVLQPILQRKPGDKIKFLVDQEGTRREIEVVLGGSIEVAESDPLRGVKIGSLVNPRIEIARFGDGRFNVSRQPEVAAEDDQGPTPIRPAVDTQLFERALERYGKLIVKLQEDLKTRDAERGEARREIQALQAEVERLKKQLESPKK